MQKAKFSSPKEYMTHRRPYGFSDSEIIETGGMDRSYLEYLLSTLGERSQELNFETFSKKICEKIVCPNLLEQTGPVAGGDGKTDTQTFPVSEQIKEQWFEGINKGSEDERWAFAVSTQKDWRAKCRKDVEKIYGVDRGYKRAFYITNRAAKADVRAKLEDELTLKYDIKVTIFDISWILDQVFKNNLETLAIDALGLDVTYKQEKKIGENDYSKQQELDEILKAIDNDIEPGNIHWEQVSLFIKCALLSKTLEEPILKTQGYFDRAIAIAKRYGTKMQYLESCYEYAWAAFFWFEDKEIFHEQFSNCLEVTETSSNSVELEKIVNLLNLLLFYYKRGESLENYTEIKQRITDQLISISKDKSRPSNSLTAHIHLEFLNLLSEKPELESIFNSFSDIISEGSKLIGFPFDKISNVLFEMEDVFDNDPRYEELIDKLTEIEANRVNEKSTANLLLKRGVKRLEKGENYDAIKLFGKAMWRLYKDESRVDFVQACMCLSNAYESIGLLWSSRACSLFAASTVTDWFYKESEITPLMVLTYKRLAWSELKLGRIGHSAKWFESVRIIDAQLKESVLTENELQNYDGCLSHVICNCNLEQLAEIKNIAPLFEKLGLVFSYGSLLLAIGEESKYEKEFGSLEKDRFETMLLVRDYVITDSVVQYNSSLGKVSRLKSKILGCEISIEFSNKTPFIEFSEALLSGLEGFLSTGMIDGITVISPRVDIYVSSDDDEEVSISHSMSKSKNGYDVEIMCSSFDHEYITGDLLEIFSLWFKEFIIELMVKICLPNNKGLLEMFESLMKDDEAFSRSFLFGTSLNSVYNIMGKNAYNDILDCFLNKKSNLEVVRSKPWDYDSPKIFPEIDLSIHKKGIGDGSDKVNLNDVRHDQISTSELIKPNLWDGAGWNAMGYLSSPNTPPCVMIAFKNVEMGRVIFEDLYKEIGKVDKKEDLKISIVTGISKASPYWYRVVLSQNVLNLPETILYQMVSRILEMTPSSSENLDLFRRSLKAAGEFKLAYGASSNDGLSIPNDTFDIAITKKQITIIEAWKVEENDMEAVAIYPDDDLIIPDNVSDIPAHKIQEKRSVYNA